MKVIGKKPRVYFDAGMPQRHGGVLPFSIHWKKGAKPSKSGVLVTLVTLLVLLPIAYTGWYVFAHTTELTPVTCTGDWLHAGTLVQKQDGVYAIPTEIGQRIFCSFAPLNDKTVAIQSATLSLSFVSLEEVDIGVPEVEESIEEETVTEELSSEEGVPAELPQEEPAPSELPQEPEETPEPAPESIESPSEPLSFLKQFLLLARAQEEIIEEVPEPAPVEEPAVEEVIQEESVVEYVQQDEVPAIEEDQTDRSNETDPSQGPHTNEEPLDSTVAISYTLDGTSWIVLDTATPRGKTLSFDLPLTTTGDLDRLVVRVTAESLVEDTLELKSLTLTLQTESPLSLLPEEEIIPLEYAAGVPVRIYTKEVVIDPEATHTCLPVPDTLVLNTSTTTLISLLLSEGEGSPGLITSASETLVEVLTASSTEESAHTEEAVQETEEVVTEALPEETVASTTEEVPEESGVVAEVLNSITEATVEVFEVLATPSIGVIEIGSLPSGYDVRFKEVNRYEQEVFHGQTELPLQVYVPLPEEAQQGSFSIPIIFTKRDGDSSVVCQLLIRNQQLEEE